MNRFFVAVLGALLVVGVGCSKDDKHDHGDKAMKASGDVCSHCPGVQKANADGKCPVCAAKAAGASSAADECPACPGAQTASAAGKCPGCDAVIAKK